MVLQRSGVDCSVMNWYHDLHIPTFLIVAIQRNIDTG